MRVPTLRHGWSRWVFRASGRRTTWTFRLALLALAVGVGASMRPYWTSMVAKGLVCEDSWLPSDAILIENFETEYLVFERARDVREAGVAQRVLVPVRVAPDGAFDEVAREVTQVMARISHLGAYEPVPMREIEPISLHVAKDVLAFASRRKIHSLTVVTPLFRSRRSALVYSSVLEPAGIAVRCIHARSSREVNSWTSTWHGVQSVMEQWIKLAYYRAWVLPFKFNA